jgi:hypothetical protein
VVLVALTILLGFSVYPAAGWATLILTLYWVGVCAALGVILLFVGAIRFICGRRAGHV